MLGEVVLGPVLEAVQVLDLDGAGEVDEAGVDVLGVLVPVHEEGADSEVRARDADGGAASGQRQLVHGVQVHVQDPELLLLLNGIKHLNVNHLML